MCTFLFTEFIFVFRRNIDKYANEYGCVYVSLLLCICGAAHADREGNNIYVKPFVRTLTTTFQKRGCPLDAMDKLYFIYSTCICVQLVRKAFQKRDIHPFMVLILCPWWIGKDYFNLRFWVHPMVHQSNHFICTKVYFKL